MKLFASASASALALLISSSVFAKPAFHCPSESEFMDEFTDLFKAASPFDAAERPEQAATYFKVWPAFIPNHDLHVASFERNGQVYELVGVKGSYIGRSGYLDAYTVVFAKGESKALATIKTDTDRSDYICTELSEHPDQSV